MSGALASRTSGRLARVRGPQTRELCQRRGMERARLHLVDLERAEPSLELTCRLVGECDGEDLRGLERSAHDLTGDPMRDGGRLPRPGAGQDRDRPAGASAASRWDSFRPASTLSRSGTRPTLASDRRPPAVIEITPTMHVSRCLRRAFVGAAGTDDDVRHRNGGHLMAVGTSAGKTFIRPDGREKVTGVGRYTADLGSTGMAHAAFRYADHPHAKILRIDDEGSR